MPNKYKAKGCEVWLNNRLSFLIMPVNATKKQAAELAKVCVNHLNKELELSEAFDSDCWNGMVEVGNEKLD